MSVETVLLLCFLLVLASLGVALVIAVLDAFEQTNQEEWLAQRARQPHRD